MPKTDVFAKAFENTIERHEEVNQALEAKKVLTESDFLLMAFQSLIKAYLARIGKDPSEPADSPFLPPVFLAGK